MLVSIKKKKVVVMLFTYFIGQWVTLDACVAHFKAKVGD